MCADNPYQFVGKEYYRISKDSSSITTDFISNKINLNRNNQSNSYPTDCIAMSFSNAKYLIIARSQIYVIGSQTSSGSTETFFLERVEEE